MAERDIRDNTTSRNVGDKKPDPYPHMEDLHNAVKSLQAVRHQRSEPLRESLADLLISAHRHLSEKTDESLRELKDRQIAAEGHILRLRGKKNNGLELCLESLQSHLASVVYLLPDDGTVDTSTARDARILTSTWLAERIGTIFRDKVSLPAVSTAEVGSVTEALYRPQENPLHNLFAATQLALTEVASLFTGAPAPSWQKANAALVAARVLIPQPAGETEEVIHCALEFLRGAVNHVMKKKEGPAPDFLLALEILRHIRPQSLPNS